MNDDGWIQALAQEKREQEADERARFDERWDRLAAGTLTPEEDAELRALAATSDEAREAYEAFRPLGPEFQARVVQEIRKQGLAPLPKPLPFPRRFPEWIAAAAAAAAAVLMFFLGPAASFPNYDITVKGFSSTRGEQLAPTGVKVFAPGDPVSVNLRPQKTASHIWPWNAGCYLFGGDEARRLKALEKSINDLGVVNMKCAISDELKPGMWTLWAVVGRWGRLPDPASLRFPSTRGPIQRRDWIAVGEEVRIQPLEP